MKYYEFFPNPEYMIISIPRTRTITNSTEHKIYVRTERDDINFRTATNDVSPRMKNTISSTTNCSILRRFRLSTFLSFLKYSHPRKTEPRCYCEESGLALISS